MSRMRPPSYSRFPATLQASPTVASDPIRPAPGLSVSEATRLAKEALRQEAVEAILLGDGGPVPVTGNYYDAIRATQQVRTSAPRALTNQFIRGIYNTRGGVKSFAAANYNYPSRQMVIGAALAGNPSRLRGLGSADAIKRRLDIWLVPGQSLDKSWGMNIQTFLDELPDLVPPGARGAVLGTVTEAQKIIDGLTFPLSPEVGYELLAKNIGALKVSIPFGPEIPLPPQLREVFLAWAYRRMWGVPIRADILKNKAMLIPFVSAQTLTKIMAGMDYDPNQPPVAPPKRDIPPPKTDENLPAVASFELIPQFKPSPQFRPPLKTAEEPPKTGEPKSNTAFIVGGLAVVAVVAVLAFRR